MNWELQWYLRKAVVFCIKKCKEFLFTNFIAVLPKSVQRVIEEFGKLPGIGQKTAERLTFFMLKQPNQRLLNFGEAVSSLRKNLFFCKHCHNLAENECCAICENPKRDRQVVCVVEEVLDIIAFEKTGEFTGLYHVLQGVISPVNGVGPCDLTLESLKKRVESQNVREIILATNPTIEGEATALYIAKMIQPFDIKVTRIARGLPTGSDLEYADKLTLSRSLHRRQV